MSFYEMEICDTTFQTDLVLHSYSEVYTQLLGPLSQNMSE